MWFSTIPINIHKVLGSISSMKEMKNKTLQVVINVFYVF